MLFDRGTNSIKEKSSFAIFRLRFTKSQSPTKKEEMGNDYQVPVVIKKTRKITNLL